MAIDIRNEQSYIDVDIEFIKKKTSELLKILDLSKYELSILILDNKLISKLNKKYLGKNKATDVLSFDAQDKNVISGPGRKLLGDVVISAQMARAKSRQLKISFNQELTLYVIHGVLHLLGYEDKSLSERRKIQKRQKELMKQLELLKKGQD